MSTPVFDWQKVRELTRRRVPDEIERMSERQRRQRLKQHADLISMRPLSPALRQGIRNFLRVGIAIPTVPNPPGELRFGAWIELSGGGRVEDLEALFRSRESGTFDKICRGKLANELAGYPGSLGLKGECKFKDKQGPPYLLLADADHPLVLDQRDGLSEARLWEWLLLNAAESQAGS